MNVSSLSSASLQAYTKNAPANEPQKPPPSTKQDSVQLSNAALTAAAEVDRSGG